MARALASVAVFLVAVLVLRVNAQTVDSGHWLSCDVDWLVEDHRSGPNFTVSVSFRGQGISGVRVSLTALDPPPRVVATADTDSGGTAHFFAIPPGKYEAHVDGGLLAPGKDIEITPDDSISDRVQIEWPQSPIVTRNLSGRILSWQKSSPQNRADLLPHRQVLVQLLDLRSGKSLGKTYTSVEGRYDFPALPAGLYVLRVNEHEDPSVNSYDIAIEVSGGAESEQMRDLELDSVCGSGLIQSKGQDRDHPVFAAARNAE